MEYLLEFCALCFVFWILIYSPLCSNGNPRYNGAMNDPAITLPTLDIEGIFYAFYRFLLSLGNLGDSVGDKVTIPGPESVAFQNFYFYTEVFFFLLGIVALVVYIYYTMEKKRLLAEQTLLSRERYKAVTTPREKNPLWDSIQEHLAGDSPAGWKLAIIEADKILDDITIREGFFGETLGERLKNADESIMRNLQDAWEAHKLRNRIAHESGFRLSRREAQHALGRYEKVFREFGAI
ncbi:MAG: hypothetical protein COV10_03475 [Candidatus Vogelbacteria bacterium CG10_big_fil_rev_8_21_14_0_10_51_16]|uniref:Uncharacterized protein n=1 Tax=Candidatus Vogelbacteria bacterium CG10_big_fil_rev_8_21_14_0_10_51_16 TaxID=1975045 RepID=A0A2H0RE09_9BACT|nr:MAG: hypothetical protein COV10_03475 [Candidatus Vogelbacteria bacterium CG10_big_fil_rev_8_21_14_0_10_51_16]